MPLRNHHNKARHPVRGLSGTLKGHARLRRAPVCVPCLIALMLLAVPAAWAQIENAESFFNSGAQFYISNNIPEALDRTETGLKLYPDNVKLKKLEQLLKQQQQQQSQQQQKSNQSQKNESSQPQQSQNQQQSQSDQEKQKQQQDQSARQKQQEQQQRNAQAAEKKEGEQKEHAPGQMTPQEAQRLLDSQKENEQFLQLKPDASPRSQQPAEDW